MTDDVALLIVESSGGQPVTLSTAAGFVAVANSPQAIGLTTIETQISVFWARATSSAMATPTVADPGDHVDAQIFTYRNVIRTGNPWDVTGGGCKILSSTSLTVTGVTTTGTDTLMVQAAARDDDSAAAEFGSITNAGRTSIGLRSDGGTSQGNGGDFAVWDCGKGAIGATGNTTATIATAGVNAFLTIALKPAPLVVTAATLNGAANVTVLNGSTMTAVVNATVAAGFQWRSTGWRIAGTATGAVTCIDHTNHDVAGSFSETFNVTAPSTVGTYDAYFIAYTDDACCANPSSALVLTGGVVTQSYVEFNSTGGNTATDGLHFYIEDTTHVQVKRANNTGQVYAPRTIPPSNSLDNGIFLRANGLVYGPTHTVSTFTPSGGMYSTYTITPASPANPSSSGVQQTATGAFGITAGPHASVLWKYTTPLDFITADVTVTIPAGYTVSAANPVRYDHVYDTYLGGGGQRLRL